MAEMTCATDSNDFLVSTNPNDALLFSVTERDQERNILRAQVTVNTGSSCPVTKAVEVCVNGVKQVVIVPMALSANGNTTMSPANIQPSVSMSSLSLDNRPDDIKLLAQSCFEMSSSALPVTLGGGAAQRATVPNQFTGAAALLLPRGLSSISDGPRASLPPMLSQRPDVSAAERLRIINSLINGGNQPSRSIPPPYQPYPPPYQPRLPPYPTTAASCNFSPFAQSRCTTSLPAGRNTIAYTPFPPGFNQLQQAHGNPLARAPLLPNGQVPVMSVMPGDLSTASGTVMIDYLQPPSVTVAHQPAFGAALQNSAASHATNYPYVPQSLQRVPYSNPLMNTHGLTQLQQYLARKRGISPQNSAPGVQCSSHLVDLNSFVTQFRPRVVAPSIVASQIPSANANGASVSYLNTTLDTTVTSSYLPCLYTNTAVKSESVGNHRAENFSFRSSVDSNNMPVVFSAPQTVSHSIVSRYLQPVTSDISHYTSSPVSRTVASNAAAAAVTLSSQLPWSQTDPHMLCSRPVTNAETDFPRTTSSLQSTPVPLTAVTTSAVVTVDSCASQAVSHQTNSMQSSVAITEDSSESFITNGLQFNVATDLPVTIVETNSVLAANPILSSVLGTDFSVPNSPSNCVGTESDAVLQSGAGLEPLSSHPSDGLGDLPPDIMVESAENDSLLMSFCQLFEQSDNAQQQTSGVPSQAKADTVSNDEQAKESIQQEYLPSVPSIQHEDAQRALQIAKSVGKGRYFSEQVRERRKELRNRKRRRRRLTGLEEADEDSSSSDSWHPDSQSESSDYETALSPVPSVALSPTPSPASSVSRYSDDSVIDRRTRQPRKHRQSRHKWSSHYVSYSSQALMQTATPDWPLSDTFIKECSVVLEQLRLQGQHSVNLRLVNNLFCCSQGCRDKRRVLSDSESSTSDDRPPIKKLRIKLPCIQDSDSSS